MSFRIGDETDRQLCNSIMHEFSRCEIAFMQFLDLQGEYILQNVGTNEHSLMTYNSYALFIQHLYEFFVGCKRRDLKKLGHLDHEIIDSYLNSEVDRILCNWVFMIDKNIAPTWSNCRDYYVDTCPVNFGRDFRQVRNSVAHTDPRRIKSNRRILLSEFFTQYHKYVMLLYYSGRDWWSIRSIDDIDLGDVTNFNRAIYKMNAVPGVEK